MLTRSWIVPATPNLALFLSSIARLQSREEASLPDSGEVSGEAMMELRWEMVFMSASCCLRLVFRERLKRMANERIWIMEEGDLERVRKAGIASCVCATKFLF